MLDRLPVSGDWMMGLAALSLAMLVVSPLVLAVVVTWLPADYFVTGEPPLGSLANRHPAVRVAFHLGKKIPVTYLLYPDEGHGFARPENTVSFFAVMEAFLSKHLDGRYEPIGKAFEGSSVEVREGSSLVPGLADVRTAKPTKD